MQVSSVEQLLPPPLLNSNALLCCPPSDDLHPRQERAKDGKRATQKIGGRVLLVGLLRELALYRAEVLRNYGYRVSIPDTVEDAIRIIEEGDFDAAVLSYTLPNQVVQELAETVRESCPSCPIVAIFDTSRADRRIAPDAVAIAQDGPPGLIEALSRVLRPRNS
jgi:CheY-like chemotaxis protein